jgi:PAS domain S-box-containing protein
LAGAGTAADATGRLGMTPREGRAGYIGWVAALLVGAGVGITSYRSVTEQSDASHAVEQKLELLGAMASLEAAVTGALASISGTELPANSPARVEKQGREVLQLIGAEPDLSRDVDRFVRALEAETPKAAAQPPAATAGNVLEAHAALSQRLQRIRDRETSSLAQLRSERATAAQRTRVTMVVGSAVSFALLGWALYWLRRENVLRLASEQAALRARAQAKRAHERSDKMLHSAPDATIVANTDGRIVEWNERALAVFGYEAKEFEALTVEDLLPRSARPGHASQRAGFFKKPTARPMGQGRDLSAMRKDGSEFPAEISLASIETEDGRLAIAAVRDVTVQREAARELMRQRERSDAANRELEAFSYSVAHDLRSPLRSVDGFSQALIEDHGAELSPGAHEYLTRIRAAAQRMGRLIDDLLSLSRVSRSDLTRGPVDLSHLAREVLESLQGVEPRAIEVHIADGLVADADPRLTRILLENLLGNALKFTSKVPNPKIEVGATEREGDAYWFVRDNGAGFDAAHAKKLFGVFQRAHREDEFPGTGIGLATVERIVRRHGGRAFAEGEVGKGATVFFSFERTGKASDS